MSAAYYVTLLDGKYKFLIDDATGLMQAAYRNEESWPAGYEMRHMHVFMAALWRVHELETVFAQIRAAIPPELNK
jgi:hypothetical protein